MHPIFLHTKKQINIYIDLKFDIKAELVIHKTFKLLLIHMWTFEIGKFLKWDILESSQQSWMKWCAWVLSFILHPMFSYQFLHLLGICIGIEQGNLEG